MHRPSGITAFPIRLAASLTPRVSESTFRALHQPFSLSRSAFRVPSFRVVSMRLPGAGH